MKLLRLISPLGGVITNLINGVITVSPYLPLVGDWTHPFEKMRMPNWIIFPQVGVKMKNVWNHLSYPMIWGFWWFLSPSFYQENTSSLVQVNSIGCLAPNRSPISQIFLLFADECSELCHGVCLCVHPVTLLYKTWYVKKKEAHSQRTNITG